MTVSSLTALQLPLHFFCSALPLGFVWRRILGQLSCSSLVVYLFTASQEQLLMSCPARDLGLWTLDIGLKRGRLALNARSFMHPRLAFTWDLWGVARSICHKHFIWKALSAATPSKLIRPGWGWNRAMERGDPGQNQLQNDVTWLRTDCNINPTAPAAAGT